MSKSLKVLASGYPKTYSSLGRTYLSANAFKLNVSAGKGRRSQDGSRGKMTVAMQFVCRLFYGTVKSPSSGEYSFSIYGLSPLGAAMLTRLAIHNEWGQNIYDSLRFAATFVHDAMLKFYVPPVSGSIQSYSDSGKHICPKEMLLLKYFKIPFVILKIQVT